MPAQKKILQKKKKNPPNAKNSNTKVSNTRTQAAKGYNATYTPSDLAKSSQMQRKSQAIVTMSKCAIKYALSIANPFNVAARGVCLPTVPAPDSFKTAGFIRGTCFIGTAGVGYILVLPSLANDCPSLFVTTAAYTGTSTLIISAVNVLVPGILPLNVASIPFSAANLSQQLVGAPNVTGRCVSAGLNVQYVGTLMNTSGVVYALRDPAHNNVSLTGTGGIVGNSATSLGARAEASLCPFTSEKCYVTDFSADMAETAYFLPNSAASIARNNTMSIYPYSNANSGYGLTSGLAYGAWTSLSGVEVGAPTSVILFTGVPGSAVQFEYIQHCEYIGPGAAALTSQSESDLPGLSKVLGAAETIVERSNAQPHESRWALMRQSLAEVIRSAAPIVLPILESAVMALLV